MVAEPAKSITPQEALGLFSQLVEQTRLLPADYRKLQHAIAVLSKKVNSCDISQCPPREVPKEVPSAPTEGQG